MAVELFLVETFVCIFCKCNLFTYYNFSKVVSVVEVFLSKSAFDAWFACDHFNFLTP